MACIKISCFKRALFSLFFMSCSIFYLFANIVEAGSFFINVNDISGIDSSWPLSAGIPFPRGEIKNSANIRITSEGNEVPSQIDVAATWPDGSIRWALAGFTASPQGLYRVEYGEGIERKEYASPLKVEGSPDGDFTVNTGSALYRFEKDKLLPEAALIVKGGRNIPFLEGSGAGVYLVDNSGREARVAGLAAEIKNEVLKEGPGRFVIKRSGWYVTASGEKTAKAEVWLYFSQGTPFVKITHSLIFTEDTNRIWFKDYGLEFKTPVGPVDVYCSSGEAGKEDVTKVAAQGREIYMLQDLFPHFAEREYRAVVGTFLDGQERIIENLKVAGDWGHGDYGNFGITIVMPWLAERFPKEISFGKRGARAVLWSGRSGRELDFRGKTLVNEYWQSWAEKGRGSPGAEKLSSWPSNAQGAARTHDIWFLPHAGAYNENNIKKNALAAARPPLVIANPAWLCKTEVLGFPMLHRDEKKFPAEEEVILEYWKRFTLPLKAFPFNGFISWGHFPLWYYDTVDGKIMGRFHVLSSSDPYGMRKEPWVLYARSGERGYYEQAYKFSRFAGDWYMAHIDVPGDPGKEKGGLTYPPGAGRNLPFFWGDRTIDITYLSNDCIDWLFEYYLTGSEQARDLCLTVKEAMKERWTAEGKNNIKAHKALMALSMMDWDEEITGKAKQLTHHTHQLIDLKSQNGAAGGGNYGPMYKDSRNMRNNLEYYIETGDELARQAFLKIADQRYRFDRTYNQIGYKNYEGFTYSCAYWMTGDERYRRIAEQTMRDALYIVGSHPSVSKELAGLPENPLDWKNMPPYLQISACFNPFMGLPVALKLISEKGWSGRPYPLAIKPMKQPQSEILFEHKKGVETRLSIYLQKDVDTAPGMPEVYPYGEKIDREKRITGVKAVFEKKMDLGPYWSRRPDYTNTHYNANITVPSEIPGGLYILSIGEERDTFTLLDSTSDKVSLYCPEGFWSPSAGKHGEALPYGRLGEGEPLFFRVPAGLGELKIFIGFPARVKRADGSVAVEMSDKNMGELNVPILGKDGIWMIEPFTLDFKGTCPPAFYKLLNVEPVVAFSSPSLLPEATDGKPAILPAMLPPSAKTLAFIPGISGGAARLSKEKSLSFPCGEIISQGGYAYFPGKKGTVEFWFLPRNSTCDIPLGPGGNVSMSFIGSPHINLRYSYMRLGSGKNIFSYLQSRLMPDKGTPQFGFQGEYYLDAGRWRHFAFTWDIKEGEKGSEGDFAIFADGRKLPYDAVAYGMIPLAGKKKAGYSDSPADIILGPFEGAMDNLRISDIVRYDKEFLPSKTVPETDKNTRVLFLFDGTLKGISAFSKEPVELK